MSTNNLRDEVLGALKRGESNADMLAIVLRHKARGMSQKATYDALESIRVELGCDADENPLCERLETIMDRVWGYCSHADAIWDSSLSEVQGE